MSTVTIVAHKPVRLSDGKRGFQFLPVTDRQTRIDSALERQPWVFADSQLKKSALYPVPGMVYEVELGEKPGTMKVSTAKQLGYHAEAIAIRAVATAARAELDAEADAKKERDADPLREAIEPIRAMYRRLPAPARAQMLARIVHLLSN